MTLSGTPLPSHPTTTETYDLVVVGGGISGLAAAYFYRQKAGNKARILILDNHDDFGGHAKRNEFTAGHRMVLSYGGTQSIESPDEYSTVAKSLLTDLGIDTSVFYKAYDQKLYSKLGTAVFFDRETFGQDRLVTGLNTTPWPDFLEQAPLSDAARRDIARVYTANVDYLPGMTREQKRATLGQDELCPLPDQGLQRHARSAAVFPVLVARFIRSRNRRRARARHVTKRAMTTEPSSTPASTASTWASARKRSPTSSISPTATPRLPVCWCVR